MFGGGRSPARCPSSRPTANAQVAWQVARRQGRARTRAGRHAERDLRGDRERHDRPRRSATGAVGLAHRSRHASSSAGVGADATLVVVGTDKGDVLAFDTDGKPLWQAKVTSEVLGPPQRRRRHRRRLVGRRAHLRALRRRRQDEVGVPAHAIRRSRSATTRAARSAAAACSSGTAGGKLLALDLATGNVGWEANVATPKGATELERIADVTSLPLVEERQVCAVAFQGRVACFEILRGTLVWSRDMSSLTGLAVDTRYHLRRPTTRARCTRSTRRPAPRRGSRTSSRRARLGGPQIAGEYSCVVDAEGYVYLLDRSDGNLVGRAATDGTPATAQPARAGAMPSGRPPTGLSSVGAAEPAVSAACARPRRSRHRSGDATRGTDAAHPRPRRAPERRQVDAVQPADAQRAPRSSPTFPASRATGTTATAARRAAVHRRRHRRLRAGREGRHPARDGAADARRRSPRPTRYLPRRRRAGPARSRTATIADLLRRSGRPVVARGQQGRRPGAASAPRRSSTSSAWANRMPISAAHGENVGDLIELALVASPRGISRDDEATHPRPTPARQGRDRRPAERRQVHAGQRAGRRGARDRLRRAGHDARRDRGAFERNGRRYTLIDTAGLRRRGKVLRGGGEVLGGQDAAGDRGRQRRGAGARRRGGHLRAGRARRGLHPRGGPRGGGRGQQVGRRAGATARRASSATSPGSSGSSASPTRTSSRRATARASRALMRSVDAAYAAAMAKLLDAQAHARADRRGRAPAAAARGHGAARSCATRTRAGTTRRAS